MPPLRPRIIKITTTNGVNVLFSIDIKKPILPEWNKQTETKAVLRRMTFQDDTIVNSHLVRLMVMEKSGSLPSPVGRLGRSLSGHLYYNLCCYLLRFWVFLVNICWGR